MNHAPTHWLLVSAALVLAGGPLQWFAALVSLGSTLALTAAWLHLLRGWL